METENLKEREESSPAYKMPWSNFGSNPKKVLMEVFIIVFSITLSIWLNNWSEHRKQVQEGKEFLQDLRDDLNKDIQSMTEKNVSKSEILKTCLMVANYTPEQMDTVQNVSLNFALSTFKANNGNYEGFKSSGKIGYIKDKNLKKQILEYYQEYIPALYDVDKYQYSKHLEVWEQINALDQKNTLTNPVLRSKIILDAQITGALVDAYENTIQKADSIIKKIDGGAGK